MEGQRAERSGGGLREASDGETPRSTSSGLWSYVCPRTSESTSAKLGAGTRCAIANRRKERNAGDIANPSIDVRVAKCAVRGLAAGSIADVCAESAAHDE